MATKFDVHLDEQHDHPHRHLRHVVEIIEAGDLSESVKTDSIETFRRIAEAEAEVHGTTIEKVHFHEVGAVDSIIDIVGTHLALEQLKVDHIISSPLHVGSGTVKCAHGVMPVPAPMRMYIHESTITVTRPLSTIMRSRSKTDSKRGDRRMMVSAGHTKPR